MSGFWNNKRVLVTGGTGFLGKYLCEELLKQGAEVRALDYRRPLEDTGKTEFYEADIRDREKMGFLCKGREFLFHLAAMPSIARGTEDDYYQVNVKGTYNVLSAALDNGIRKVVHVSSSTVYGIPDVFPLKEDSPVHPLGKYGRSKLEAENVCRDFVSKGINVSIIRPRVIIGPGRIGIFSILFDQIRQDKPVYIIGNGDNIFQFTNVLDMSSACMKAAEYEKPDLFNIGSQEAQSVREELGRLIAHAGSKSRIIGISPLLTKASLRALSLLGVSPLVEEQFAIADRNFKLDTGHARQCLGWVPQYSNFESLQQAYDWYVVNNKQRQYKGMLGILGKFRHSHMGGFQHGR